MPELKIIKASKKMVVKYIAKLEEIDCNCFGAYSWGNTNFLKPQKNKFKMSLMALYADQLVGYVIASEYLPNLLHIHRFAVGNKFRGMGIGKALLEYLIKNASLNYNKITVETESNFLNAIYLYEKFGFKKLIPKRIISYLTNKQKISELPLYINANQPNKRIVFELDLKK